MCGGGYGFADSYLICGLRMRFLCDGVADGAKLMNYAISFVDMQSIKVLRDSGSAVYRSSAPGGVVDASHFKTTHNDYLVALSAGADPLPVGQATAFRSAGFVG